MAFGDFELFVEELRKISTKTFTKRKLLTVVSACADFDGTQIRSGERALLRHINSRIRYPLKVKPSQWKEKEKIFLLLQSALDGLDITVSYAELFCARERIDV